jgi:pyruvate,orthophosphate dikinase
MPYVYTFDHEHERSPMELKDLLGGKGANLAEMSAVLGLPVPPGFTITTEACRAYRQDGKWPSELQDEVADHLDRLEATMGRQLGDAEDPLLVSVRSGAKFSMPGMMDTVLNLGLNDASVEGLASVTGDERFAYDSYRRFLTMYARIVLGLESASFDEEAADPRELCDRHKALVAEQTGAPFPQDRWEQLHAAIEAVFASWDSPRAQAYRAHEGIPDDLGTAVTVQVMVFGNRDDSSGTGVGFTRDAATGDDQPYGDFLVNAQGEDVVAGIRNTEDLNALARKFPDIHAQLLDIFTRLEAHYRDMCDTEFTIEQGRLWMLQTRVGKRTAQAALKMAVDMVAQKDSRTWSLTREEALGRVSPQHLDQVLHPQFAQGRLDVLTTGLAASPGAAVGRVYLTADDAVVAAERGEPVILVRNETSPEDVHGMQVAQGILTARGGLVSHAAVVARGWGIPAVVGAESLRISDHQFSVGDTAVHEGDEISLDGTNGRVVLGSAALASTEPPAELKTVLEWADEVRGGDNPGGVRLAVRANADTGPDAALARRFGAEGIGLCRTEHMFLGDRLPIVREMILADGAQEEAAALERLREAQRADFVEVLEAMDGRPVTVRLLDPPLHEFLPRLDELRAVNDPSAEDQQLLEAAELWQETNPMLGVRGVRLGVLKPGLYAMQVRALSDAVAERQAAGGDPVVEIMIPLTVTREELAEARRWVTEAVDATKSPGPQGAPELGSLLAIGTMIETPRAALRAAELATEADFFSFGTNDLTQMTFGFSRDDVEARMMPAYLERGLLPANPFDTVDQAGVGELVTLGVQRGRTTRPGLQVGVCGEHGGDPASIAFFLAAGVDYVSCSPYRVPVARLAAAQAIIAA